MHGDGIVGILIQKIPTCFPNLYQLISAEDHVPPALRQKWVAQIDNTVNELHRHGIIWGDVKPDNIVIDEHDDAWLIDFGGGYNPQWVDASIAGSIEGDLQGVERLKSMLKKE
jgi:serine/threonine protein kinase